MIETDVDFNKAGKRVMWLGLLLLLLAAGLAVRTCWFIARAEKTAATWQISAGTAGVNAEQELVLIFKDKNGRTVKLREPVPLNFIGNRQSAGGGGDVVDLWYDPEDPQRFYLDDFYAKWWLPVNFAAVGLIALAAGFIMRRYFFF